MDICVAKTAGFCFGVDRAINILNSLLDQGKKACTLGPIIHNEQVVNRFCAQGVLVVKNIDEIPDGYTAVIRSHGAPKEIFSELQAKKIDFVDATCPFVKKIHNIVEKESSNANTILIAGNSTHPEVEGIRGYCKTTAYTFNSLEQLKLILRNNKVKSDKKKVIVAQTTFNTSEWSRCINLIKNLFTNISVYDTICNTTQLRQNESEKLSKISDCMIVIGGRSSSNTSKLYDICRKHCDTFFVETSQDLILQDLKKYKRVGITAGASTPEDIIREVKGVMVGISKETDGDNENFEAMLEESLKNLSTGGRVRGTVVSITPTEVYVDIGRKQAGYIPLSELTDNPDAKTEDIVKVGEALDLLIMRTDDQEGMIKLSKTKIDSDNAWNSFSDLCKEKVVLCGIVKKVVKGGLIVSYKSNSIFIPSSHVGGSRNIPFDDYINKEVRFHIIEVDKSKKRIVGSIRSVIESEREEILKKFWEEIEVGKKYVGTVRSMTNYGVFVDLGGIDGMIHISELAWNRVDKPSDILNIGQEVEVSVKSFDKEKSKVALTYKKLEDSPWEKVKIKYPIGTVFETKILNIVPYGAFARVEPGIDGLIHISQMSQNRIESPKEVLSVGDTVKVKVRDIDDERKRISLTMKQIDEDI